MLSVEGGTRVTQLTEELKAVPREENRWFAQTIPDVVELTTLRVQEELAVSGDLDKATRIPVAERLSAAGSFTHHGRRLHRQRPAAARPIHTTRAAFEAGGIGFAHVREIVTARQA